MKKAIPSAAAKRASKPASARRAANPVSMPAPAPKASKVSTRKPSPPIKKAAKPDTAQTPLKAKVWLVRDGFTMPEPDFALIGKLKARTLAAQRETKKSEILRAGLRALAELDSASLVAALNRLEPVKTGRPKKAR